ncbi:hypothetical protein ZIOFF_043136 [Zingiber officinale]|uniref:BRCT domain-containing protein n=1 Tax=Zingiber officinale TaxID=94328 RepID=A0A8J5FUF2_ZINOF|nr:hypothetical protein ZIOFF_043136 [Zingiber officinale]
MKGGNVEVISSKGCSRLLVGSSTFLPNADSLRFMASPASSSLSESTLPLPRGPFTGLVICVTGLSKARLSETLYSVKSVGENGLPSGELNRIVGVPRSDKSCLPSPSFEDGKSLGRGWQTPIKAPNKEQILSEPVFSNNFVYIDSEISDDMKKKVVESATKEGATFLDNWFIGCHASHIVCEGPSIRRYIGLANNIVTPLWILKTAKEKCIQRLVHLSSDIAKQVNMILESDQDAGEVSFRGSGHPVALRYSHSLPHGDDVKIEERLKTVELAKLGVRNRRNHRMQVPIHPITPNTLLESICWTVSEPVSSTRIYTESSWIEDATEQHPSRSLGDDGNSEASFEDFSRSLRESEKREVILRSHFLTILFPLDRFGELGPSSRTFFSDNGFTCIQILEHIYHFYQENMTTVEINLAIHTDSRHADRLRSLYASKESKEQGFVAFKRVDFLGSRRSFEKLKRVSGENNGNLYELLIRA